MRVRDDNVRRRADRPLRNAPGVADQRMTDSHTDRHTDLVSESAWSLCRPHTDRPNLTYSGNFCTDTTILFSTWLSELLSLSSHLPLTHLLDFFLMQTLSEIVFCLLAAGWHVSPAKNQP